MKNKNANILQKTEILTLVYIRSYNLALKEVRNPNLAAQIAMAVAMVINTNIPNQQTMDPLGLFFAQMANTAWERAGKEESEETDHDGTENAAD